MKKLYRLSFFMLCLLMAWNVQAQRVVVVEPSADPLVLNVLNTVIMGDTTATGERIDVNTVYKLKNGAVYVLSDRIDSRAGGWPVNIEAEDLSNTATKPVITRIPNADGGRSKIVYAGGNMTLKNLWIISGENGPLEDHHWGQIRMFGTDSRIIVEDCIIEKDRGGFLQLRALGVKCYVNRCHFRNGGNRRLLQGNGRGIDARNWQFDSLVVKNTVMHNIIDRVFRSQGGTIPHNYIEFDHNTIFNIGGRHGCFQFGRVNEVKITNNYIANPLLLGTTPVLTDEQTQPDNGAHKVFTIDTLYEGSKFNFASNNIYWSQDILDVINGIDTVNIPNIYSDLILQALGNDGTGTYFADPSPLANVPITLTQYVKDLYANPASEDMFDFVVEDIAFANTPFDNGHLFDFSAFDPCYDSSAPSATGDTGGGAVGAVAWCDDLTEGSGPGSVVDIIVGSPDHTILETAVIAAELADDLSGDGPFTVFAPTDAAIGNLPAGTLDALLADPTGALANVLLYHVLSGKVLSTDLSDGMTATTLQGKDITVKIVDGNVFINDAQVTVADIEASNGVVHVIDAVLIPPTPPAPTPVRYVYVDPGDDPLALIRLNNVVMGDTTETGERVSLNTIYQLENGRVYVMSDRIDSRAGGWPVQIEAVDLTNTEVKPIITRIPNADGGRSKIVYAGGDMTLKNLWIISGENGPLEDHHWGQIRMFGTDSRIIVEDCIIEKDRGGFLQLRALGVKCYVNRCHFRNGGNRRLLQGNGRGIDARNWQFDSLVVKNTVMHNIIDRVFRSQGGTIPHNYIEFDHNTIFNIGGRHGCFQFGRVNEVKVTNNILMNPLLLGTSPIYTDEQTQPDNGAHKVFTIDTLYEGAKFNFAANNIFWSQDVLDVLNGIDSVSIPNIYSDLIVQALGNDGSDTYIQEAITLNNVPINLTQYVIDLYANPASEEMFDFVVEDILFEGTAFDNGHLFDFSMFDPCYSPDTESAKAATNGGAIGATQTCAALISSIYEPEINNTLELAVWPNPMSQEATFSYNLTNNGEVRLSLYSIVGQEIGVLVSGERTAGTHTVRFGISDQLAKGVYIARLQTEEGQMSLKVMIR